ncbi:MAG: hypothetical protein J6K70_00910 [Selenomonadales bacterium]|nr:hypothetical protein [Selenomonadales bacterium]
MYKLILGSTRIAVHDDNIPRAEASRCARQALQKAKSNGEQLSHIDIRQADGKLITETTTKPQVSTARKTLHQSIRDSLVATLSDNFFPTGTFQDNRFWQDSDTGQEWSGEVVISAKEDILEEVRTWISERNELHN